jgi:hypothetical protein
MNLKNIALLTALVIGSASVARADSILSIGGNDVYDTTADTISFTSVASVGGTSTGIFAGFPDCTACVSMIPVLNYGAGFVPGTELFVANEGGNTATVYLDTAVLSDNITLSGADEIVLTGLNAGTYFGSYELTTQFGGDGVSNVTFSATTAVSPEPASLALFGTGLLGIVGIARRKFSV